MLYRKISQLGLNHLAKFRQQVFFEPRVFLDPGCVPPGWVWQRKQRGNVLPVVCCLKNRLPIANGISEVSIRGKIFDTSQMPLLGISAYQEDHLNLAHRVKNHFVPGRCAFASGWEISAMSVISWKTEPHWYNCNAIAIVKLAFIRAQPFAESHPGRVSERASGQVDPISRSLTANGNLCTPGGYQYRIGFMWQRVANWRLHTYPATSNALFDRQHRYPLLKGSTF